MSHTGRSAVPTNASPPFLSQTPSAASGQSFTSLKSSSGVIGEVRLGLSSQSQFPSVKRRGNKNKTASTNPTIASSIPVSQPTTTSTAIAKHQIDPASVPLVNAILGLLNFSPLQVRTPMIAQVSTAALPSLGMNDDPNSTSDSLSQLGTNQSIPADARGSVQNSDTNTSSALVHKSISPSKLESGYIRKYEVGLIYRTGSTAKMADPVDFEIWTPTTSALEMMIGNNDLRELCESHIRGHHSIWQDYVTRWEKRTGKCQFNSLEYCVTSPIT